MAFVVFVLDVPTNDIGNLNGKCIRVSSADVGINACADFLSGVAAKNPGANVQVTTRDTDPAVSTSGSGSTQVTYQNK